MLLAVTPGLALGVACGGSGSSALDENAPSACQKSAECPTGSACTERCEGVPDESPEAGTGGLGSGGGQSAGGNAGSANGSGGENGGGSNPPLDAIDVIDDLEDGDVQILATEGRTGAWYTYNEGSARPLASPPTDGGGSRAMHATGTHTGGAATPYGGLGVDLKNANADGLGPRSSSRQTYDVEKFDGFEFRIKSSGQTKSIRFEVVTSAVATTEEKGSCLGDGCFDAHGRDVSLQNEWTLVKVPFGSLVQEGWGQLKAFDATKVLGVAFEDLTNSNWDFWIDDFALYKDAPELEPGASVDPGSGVCEDSWGGSTNGSVTWYTFDQGTAGIGDINCSFGIKQNPDRVNHVATGDGQYFGAMNTADYATAAACGACVRVKRIDTGKSVDVTIVDQCPIGSNPKCVSGHIDLSRAAFLELGAESEGYLGQRAGRGQITWEYIPCPTVENVSFRLKENNPNWNMVIVEGHRYPIESVQVQVDGKWLNASRAEYNFWLPPGGKMGTKVRATDVNGDVIDGTVGDTGQQFSCQ